jgi:hypothetical protein
MYFSRYFSDISQDYIFLSFEKERMIHLNNMTQRIFSTKQRIHIPSLQKKKKYHFHLLEFLFEKKPKYYLSIGVSLVPLETCFTGTT